MWEDALMTAVATGATQIPRFRPETSACEREAWSPSRRPIRKTGRASWRRRLQFSLTELLLVDAGVRQAIRQREIAAIEQLTESDFQEVPPQFRAAVLSDQRTSLRRALDAAIFYPQIPAIAGLAVDWEGRLFVQRNAPPGQAGPIDVWHRDSGYLGTLETAALSRIPDAFGPGPLIAFVEGDLLHDGMVVAVFYLVDENESTAGRPNGQ